MDSQGHVYIVDDDAGSRRSVAALLEPMHAEVQSFELAADFLAAYHGQRPACLVTDLRMRGMSGVELLEELRQRNYSLSVLVMTAYPDTRSTVRAMRGGAINLIEKPCNPQELWDAIQQGLREDAVRYEQEQMQLDARTRLASLNSGELDVLKLLTSGKANKVIASHLDVSLRTVEARRAAIFEKLGVESVAELMKVWLSSQS